MLTADLRQALLSAANDAGYPVPGHDPVLRSGGAPGRYTAGLPLRITGQHAPSCRRSHRRAAPCYPLDRNRHTSPARLPDHHRHRRRAATAGRSRGRSRPGLRPQRRPPRHHRAISVPAAHSSGATPAPRITPAPHATLDPRSRLLSPPSRLRPPSRLLPPAPPAGRPDPWAGAHTTVLLQVTAALGRAAGASVPVNFFNRLPPRPVPTPMAPDPVTAAEAFAGAEAIRYTLARTPPGRLVATRPGRRRAARRGQSRLCCSVRVLLRCVDAALGRCPRAEPGGSGRVPAGLARAPQGAGPARRVVLAPRTGGPGRAPGRPHEFTAFLEGLAETYQVCRVACPAWPERGHVVRARLWLTGAAAAGLAAGLELLGVSAPARL